MDKETWLKKANKLIDLLVAADRYKVSNPVAKKYTAVRSVLFPNDHHHDPDERGDVLAVSVRDWVTLVENGTYANRFS